jgi:hypothetical protein
MSLILDAGAGEGETVLFYHMLGFRNFRCVESDPVAFQRLRKNTANIPDSRFELICRPFQPQDVFDADFAKIDVDGGEIELLKVPIAMMPQEIRLEIHDLRVEREIRSHLPHMRQLPTPTSWPDDVKMWSWRKHI